MTSEFATAFDRADVPFEGHLACQIFVVPDVRQLVGIGQPLANRRQRENAIDPAAGKRIAAKIHIVAAKTDERRRQRQISERKRAEEEGTAICREACFGMIEQPFSFALLFAR